MPASAGNGFAGAGRFLELGHDRIVRDRIADRATLAAMIEQGAIPRRAVGDAVAHDAIMAELNESTNPSETVSG